VNVVRGNEEYVHLKSLEDEFHYTESNMPTMTGEEGKEGVEDREEYQRVESPRKSPTATGEGTDDQNANNDEEGKRTEGEEEELERRGKEEQEQDHEGGDNMRFSETPHSPMMSQPFSSSLHSRGKYFDEADYQIQFADSPDQRDYFSQLRGQEDGKEEKEEGKDYKEQAENGNNNTNDNNNNEGGENDYDQHVLLQEPLSIPKRSSSAEQKRRDEEELARPPPQLLSTGSFSKTTMSQRSSYESLHEID
jgi:hypothetical protein